MHNNGISYCLRAKILGVQLSTFYYLYCLTLGKSAYQSSVCSPMEWVTVSAELVDLL